ncbi:MAG: hypothetical protein ABSE99_08325 [Terracidiphilus sp.]|jgi:hypothetical protein
MPRPEGSSAIHPASANGLSLALLAALSSAVCLPAQSNSGGSIFRNVDSPAAYVGSKSCAAPGCHEEIARAYLRTPHGQSMAPANSSTELGRAPEPVTVFNPKSGRYYTVYQKDGNLYQGVYELDKSGRKEYSLAHKMDYVTGGESVGYTYLFRIGPWIFQAPLSYYAHSRSWELSPGYAADDPGFNRAMTAGCLLCHNGQPEPVANRDGMYKEPPFRFGELGISCESCHGPGALHVKEMQSKKGRVLAAHEVDTSIVNPAKLSPRLADDLCRECHQAGDAVVVYPGKTAMDYRPGTPLAETMAIVKRPIKPEQREEANRLESNPPIRGSLEQPLWWKNSTLELSRCYQASHGRLTCSTCHSIHHAPRPEDKTSAYRAACLGCHQQTGCTLKPDDARRGATADNCIACHMEKRPVAGIAHSNDTKHRIVRSPGQPLPEVAFEQPRPDLPGLLWLNRPAGQAGERMPDLAQLEAYWTVGRKDPSLWPLWFKKLDELSKSLPDDPRVLNFLGAVELAQNKNNAKAADDFARALKQGSEEPTTFLNLATALDNLHRAPEAEAVLERGVAAYPYCGPLVARLAQHYHFDGQSWRARNLVQQYRANFPEDPALRAVQRQIDASAPSFSAPSANLPVMPSK